MGSHLVLVVDDSRTVRRVVERMLTAAGFDVELAESGKDALERASARTPDLVLTDFVMPHMNGLRFVQLLRAVDNLAAVPVVLMSAKADRIGESFVAQTGALDAITKPFSPEALLAVTTHALARAAAESMPPPPPLPPDPSDPVKITANGAPAPDVEDTTRTDAAKRIARALGELAVASRVAMNVDAFAAAIERHATTDVVLSWAAELASLVPDGRGERALEGAIEHVPLGDVLELLRHQRQTGTLEIDAGHDTISAGVPGEPGRHDHVGSASRNTPAEITICFSNGGIDLALERSSRREFRIGRYAVEEGLVDPDELEKLIASRTGARQLLGTHLVKLGYLRQEDLTRLLTRQTSELVYEALRWKRGRYRFARLASRPEASLARLGIPVSSVLMEGLRRVDEWRLIEEQIRSFDDVWRPDPDAIARTDKARLSREERAVLDAVDGTRTVRAIVEHVKTSSFETSKILFQLVSSRLVRR